MKNRLLSLTLALCMVLTLLPFSAMAEETDTSGSRGEITNFATLDETEMSVPTGTVLEDLGLPETLTATVRTASTADSGVSEEAAQDSGNSDEGSESGNLTVTTTSSAIEAEGSGTQEQEKEEETVSGWEELIMDIPVTWASDPEYNGNENGEYVFTPVIEGYTVSADLPEITVTVGAQPLRMALQTGTSATYGDFSVSIDQDGAEPFFENNTLTFSMAGEYTVAMASGKESTSNVIAVTVSGVTLNIDGVIINAPDGTISSTAGANAMTANDTILNVLVDSSFTGGNGYNLDNNYGGNGGNGISGDVTVTGTAKLAATGGIGIDYPLGIPCSGGAGIDGALTVTEGTTVSLTGGLGSYRNGRALTGTLTTNNSVIKGGNSANSMEIISSSNANSNYQYITVEPKVLSPLPQARWGVAGSDGTEPTTWAEGALADAMSYADSLKSSTTYIQLLENINKDNHTTWPLTFDNAESPIILDLNGKDIDRGLTAVTYDGNVITLQEGTLTLKDSSTEDVLNQGCITGGYNSGGTGGGVYVLNGCFTMLGGNIIGNRDTATFAGGGGVNVINGSSFVMQGGSIAGNEALYWGGGVFASVGSVTMTGGSITDNKSLNGGVYFSSSFTVGGTAVIENNKTTDASPVECNVAYHKPISVNSITPLSTGASIGVTANTPPTNSSPVSVTGSNSTDYSGYFFSDNSSYMIQNGANNVVQLVMVQPVVMAPLSIPDSFTAGSSVKLSDLVSHKPSVTANGVTIAAEGWQCSIDSGSWTNWSAGELPLDTESTYKLRYYVTYNDDSGSIMIPSNEVILTVVGNTTALALAASPTSQQIVGRPITLTATLTGFFAGAGVNGHSITFKNGGTTLGTASMNASGVAVFTWTPSSADTYVLTAEYAATPYNTTAVSSMVNYTVIDPDIAIVAAAKTAAQNASYANMTQTAATDEDAIKLVLKNTAETAVSNSDITTTINKVAYTPPIAGTSANSSGTNGSYTFTVTVSKGSQNETTAQKTITITATPYTGGTGGGSGSGSSKPVPSTKPTEPVTGSTENKAAVDGKGSVSVSLSDKNITDAITDAKAEAAKKGVNAGDITAVIHVTTGEMDANTVVVNLPKTTQEQVISNNISSVQLAIDRPDITIGINLAAVTEINRQAKADVQLSATRLDNTKLSGDAKTAIGNRPAYDFKAIYGGGKSVTDFGKGSVNVEIPYTLQKGEIAGNVYAVYVDTKGDVTYLTDSSYDARRGTVVFSTSHFSTYGIAYKASFNYSDIDGHWAKDDILFVANRGLMTGTSTTTFSPNGSMTRGMFVTALGRLANADISSYNKSSFGDVKNDAYYMGYIEWGVKSNILVGIGGGKFDPDGLVTREQMSVIMDRYATANGFKLTEVQAQNTFADNAQIGAWAVPSVKRIQMAGVIHGKNNNFFDPQGTATRAEASAVLRRFDLQQH